MTAAKQIKAEQRFRLSGIRGRTAALLSWGLISLLAACAPVGPDYQPPHPDLPTTWRATGAQPTSQTESAMLGQWWIRFNDPLLDSLIKRATAANLDAKIAAARVRQARAQYRLTTAAAAPTVDVSGAYSNIRRSGNASGSNSGTTQDLFQAGFDAGWELDIFGGARRAKETAAALLAAAGEERNDVLISLNAEVARNYLELRGSQQRLATADRTLAVQEQNLALARGRLDSGFGNQLEVVQAETQLALTRAQLPPLQNNIGQARNLLALLLGLPPGALDGELATVAPLPQPPELLPATLPSELLRRRPDIRRAERQLAAATAEIGVATAELFPRFSLSALLGLQSNSLSTLVSAGSRYWTVGPTLSWSLFDAGRARANIDLNKGRREEAEAVYEKTVLTALSEVENALQALQREAETRQTLAAAVASAERAVELASGRYRAGLSDFLEVLQSQSALYQSRDQLVQSEQQLDQDLVALYKALGGGWDSGDAAQSAAPGQTISAGEVKP